MSDITIIINPIYFNRPPCADIYFNNQLITTAEFNGTEIPVSVRFTSELKPSNTIKILRYNKELIDTKLVHGSIVADQILEIQNIIVDRIPFSALLHKGVFYPDYPELWASQQRQAGVELPVSENYRTTLFHNGSWELNFDTPVHVWLFKNVNISI